MLINSITIENYRQFERAELLFDSGITILAGANNSGKTSLISLIRNIFYTDNAEYTTTDIPAKDLFDWVELVYPLFQDYFCGENNVETVGSNLVEGIIPSDETLPGHLMKTTSVKIHVAYNPETDDIKLFADCIMDLDADKHDFYFLYNFEVKRSKFIRGITADYDKLKRRFEEIMEDQRKLTEAPNEEAENNLNAKIRYMKQLIVNLYVRSIVPVAYYCDKDYKNRCTFDELRQFKQLFHFCFIKASRPLDDDESDRSHLLSKQMIKMVKMDDKWNELMDRLPDELLKPIQAKEFDKKVRDTSLDSLKDTITALEQTNGGKTGELMLDMHVTEEDISDLLQRITTATYNVDGYFLGESSQGLGYSNMIYIHLQLKEYEKNIDPLKVNVFCLEEPESHMHPQMQQVFIKYILDYYQPRLQGLITTHSNEMVRVAGISHLRVIRRAGDYKSKLIDLSVLKNSIDEAGGQADHELANFFDWFFEIGYSDIVFADKAVFYEGDTERLFIRKAMTLLEYQKLSQQYVAFIQVGGAYAKNYEQLIRLLGIKSLIITDIDYEKTKTSLADIQKSESTNATIKHFFSINHSAEKPLVSNLYAWNSAEENVFDDLIAICFQTDKDGYARTLEEAMLNRYYSMNVCVPVKKREWKQRRTESKLQFSIPRKRNNTPIDDEDIITIHEIIEATSGKKTDFMYSVILNEYVRLMMPEYIDGGLKWLME